MIRKIRHRELSCSTVPGISSQNGDLYDGGTAPLPRVSDPTASNPTASNTTAPHSTAPDFAILDSTMVSASPLGGAPKKTSSWLFKGIVLAVVAIMSGLVWYLIRQDDSATSVTAQETTAPNTEFPFVAVGTPLISAECAKNSYGETQKWFADHPCSRLARAVYTVTTPQGQVAVSVALVTMPNNEQTQQLKQLTDTDGTGNVNDLLRDGTVKLPNAPEVSNGEYHSDISGNELVIVEAAPFAGNKDRQTVKKISIDAVKLKTQLR